MKTYLVGAQRLLTRDEMKNMPSVKIWSDNIKKIQNKLKDTGFTIDDWYPGSEVWMKYATRNTRRKLIVLQEKLLFEYTERQAESEHLHRSSRGNERRVKYLQSLWARRKTVRAIITNYNKALQLLRIQDMEAANGIRELCAEQLGREGMEYDELWDIARMNAYDDWARFLHVRSAIEAMCRLERCKEEEMIMRRETDRITDWLVVHHYVARSAISKEGPEGRLQYIGRLLFHYHKIARGLLRIPAGTSLSPENRTKLHTIVDAYDLWREAVLSNINAKSGRYVPPVVIKVQPASEDGYDSDLEDELKQMKLGGDSEGDEMDGEGEFDADEIAMEGEMLQKQVADDEESDDGIEQSEAED